MEEPRGDHPDTRGRGQRIYGCKGRRVRLSGGLRARNGDGWSPSCGLSVERTVNASETAMVMIYHLKDSRDYYISVTVNSGDAVVADNCGSVFYPAAQETVETENGTVGLYHWYAWVYDMDDSYRLMVEGTDVI